MSGLAGLRGTGNWGTDERPKNFREGILRYGPAGTAPIFALTSKAGKRTVDDPEFAWWCEGNAIIRLQINGALGSTDTLITVDTADPTTTTAGANLGTATNLKPGDILLCEPATDSTTFTQELIQVTDVLSDTQFTALRGAGGTTAASIADNIWLLQVGSAFAEGSSAPRAVSRNPLKYSNYIQIFKDTYELTGTADKTNTRTNNGYSEDKKRKMWQHSASIEWALLFGRKSEQTGTNGKPLRFMDGVRAAIPTTNSTVFATAVTPNTFLDAIGPIFDYDTGAGNTRMAFAGNKAIQELSKIFAGEVLFEVTDKVTVYGMDFQKFELPMGTVLLKSHPLMSRNTLYQKSMFVLDFDALKYTTMKGRPDCTVKDDVQQDDEDVRRGFIQTDCSLMTDYGGLTQAYIGNISAT